MSCPLPTLIKAYSGHSVNQSIVEQLINEGNILSLVVNWFPKGDMTMIMWMFLLTLIKYCEKMLAFVGGKLFLAQSLLQAVVISSMSFSW